MSQILMPKRARKSANDVIQALEEYCLTLAPGEQLPTRTELMRLLNASDRGVVTASDELRRQGRLIVRNGVGTFVADRTAPLVAEPPGVRAGHDTLVAIGTPDRSIFDRAMSLLLPQANAAGLSLVCRLVDSGNGASLLLPPQAEKPLGYILFRRDFLPLAQQLQGEGHRVVLIGTPYTDEMPGVPNVYGDHEQGGYLATKHLLDLGHRRLVFRGWSDWPRMRRYRGHQRAIVEARLRGLVIEDGAIFQDEYEQWRKTPALARAYFNRPNAPTGIVVWNDHEAVALLSLLTHIGVRVPQDVSLVGYDNLPESEQVYPALTTVDGGINQQLQAALSLLRSQVAPAPATTVIVLPTLISRESSVGVKS